MSVHLTWWGVQTALFRSGVRGTVLSCFEMAAARRQFEKKKRGLFLSPTVLFSTMEVHVKEVLRLLVLLLFREERRQEVWLTSKSSVCPSCLAALVTGRHTQGSWGVHTGEMLVCVCLGVLLAVRREQKVQIDEESERCPEREKLEPSLSVRHSSVRRIWFERDSETDLQRAFSSVSSSSSSSCFPVVYTQRHASHSLGKAKVLWLRRRRRTRLLSLSVSEGLSLRRRIDNSGSSVMRGRSLFFLPGLVSFWGLSSVCALLLIRFIDALSRVAKKRKERSKGQLSPPSRFLFSLCFSSSSSSVFSRPQSFLLRVYSSPPPPSFFLLDVFAETVGLFRLQREIQGPHHQQVRPYVLSRYTAIPTRLLPSSSRPSGSYLFFLSPSFTLSQENNNFSLCSSSSSSYAASSSSDLRGQSPSSVRHSSCSSLLFFPLPPAERQTSCMWRKDTGRESEEAGSVRREVAARARVSLSLRVMAHRSAEVWGVMGEKKFVLLHGVLRHGSLLLALVENANERA